MENIEFNKVVRFIEDALGITLFNYQKYILYHYWKAQHETR